MSASPLCPAGGQRGGSPGAVCICGRSAPRSNWELWRPVETRESGAGSAAAVCVLAMPRVQRRLQTNNRLNTAAGSSLSGDGCL